jgi:hypothetical protein
MNIFGKPGFLMTLIVFIMSMNLGFSADTLNIVSPSYFGEQKNVYEKINYLENELLSFEFCSDKPTEKMEFVIIPDSGKDLLLKAYENKKKKNCFFTNFLLNEISTDEFDLEIFYSVDNKEKIIKRKFQKRKQSKLINHILGLDPEVLNPVDLSHFLIVLNDVETYKNEQSVYAYDKLKVDRNNLNKCWPRDSCSIADTSRILRNLVIAGYSTSTRLIEDGRNYLNKFKISNENNPTRFDIEVDNSFVTGEEIICSLKIDDEDEVNYKFSKSTDTLTKYASNNLIFRCNETIEQITLREYTYTGSLKDSREYDSSIGFTTNFDAFSCIGSSNKCDFSATIDTLMAYGGGIEDSGLLNSYINSLIITEDDDTRKLDTLNLYEDTGKYLYYKNNKELTDMLKFSQNNVGSWGTSSIYNDIKKTAWSVIGLQKISSSSEYVKDGEKWIYFNEPDTGWGDIEKNTLAYMSIKEQIKPYLKINSVNEIEKVTKFTIENPTIHHLKDIRVVMSKELVDYVSYTESLGDLEGKTKINFDITVDSDFYSQLSGSLKITGVNGKNVRVTLLEIPVNLVGPTPISIISGNYSMTEEFPMVNLRFMKNVPNFDIACVYKNPFDGGDEKISLSAMDNEIHINNFVLKQGNFNLELFCTYGKITFTTLGNITIDLAETTFLTENTITLTSLEDFAVHVNDTSSARQTLTFEITGTYIGLIVPAETSKLIAINDDRDLFFKVVNPVLLEALGNSSSGNLIIKSTTGYKKSIPIIFDLSLKVDNGMAWWIWLLILLGVGFLGLVGFRFYEMKFHKDEGLANESFDNDDEFYFE